MEGAGKMQKHSTQRLSRSLEDAVRQKELNFVAPQELHKELHRVNMVSLIDARLRVSGKYSGREYLFERAGSVQDVDQTDVEWMLEKRQGERQCCGGTERGNKVFALA